MRAGELIEAFWRTANARDWDGFGRLLHDEVIYEVPQTRERLRGRANYVEFNQTYPGNWTATVTELFDQGAKGMSVVDFRVDDAAETGISLFEMRDGLIARITDWWPTPYDPPQRKTDKIERY
ncbi:nuclear transport factor 2 family protein [Piscinibacter terrae]|uniref:Nuclear transport factor 2 family protein n=1 Tax=Piscinibacter terrae TaxID=2496871 RepID=A0A3N7JSE5_9BURK|nr:nuclear transport factor 2 family protein [Albitalea terrae]RQP21935.1 nuclear transport factor 2 family protein [Albitalea terrae]